MGRQKMPNAQPFFFHNDRHHLYGVLYEPIENARKEGFVFCDAFAEEKLWSQRVMVAFATLLAERGYWVLRFDYMGNGESEGDFERSTLSTMTSDTQCAIKTLLSAEKSIQKVNLLGLRLGAVVAARAASQKENIGKLVMWAPVFDGKEYIKELFRINFATQLIVYKRVRYTSKDLAEKMKFGETVNVDGYKLTYQLYNDISKVDLSSFPIPNDHAVLICKIKGSGNLVKTEDRRQRFDPSWTVLFAEENIFWKESKKLTNNARDLFQKTINWLNDHDH